MQVIKAKLSDEQNTQLKMTFNLMDADGGGTIDGEANITDPLSRRVILLDHASREALLGQRSCLLQAASWAMHFR